MPLAAGTRLGVSEILAPLRAAFTSTIARGCGHSWSCDRPSPWRRCAGGELAARGGSAPRREREIFRQIKAPGRRNTGSISGFRHAEPEASRAAAGDLQGPLLRQRRAGGKEPLWSRYDFRHGLLGQARRPQVPEHSVEVGGILEGLARSERFEREVLLEAVDLL